MIAGLCSLLLYDRIVVVTGKFSDFGGRVKHGLTTNLSARIVCPSNLSGFGR